METTSQYLTDHLVKAFELAQLKINMNMVKVVYSGLQGTSYIFGALPAAVKILRKHDSDISEEKLFNILNDNLTHLHNYFEIGIGTTTIYFNPKPNYLTNRLKPILNVQQLIQKTDKPKTVLVDFSSPNIAKDMHVGHLRSTIIGDSICRTFEGLGHNVLRVNHIGDFGLQFGMLIEYLYKVVPNFETSGISISDLQNFYAQSKKHFDQDEGFKKKAYEKVVELQQGDPTVVKAWEFIKEVSRQSYNKIYNQLNVHLDEVGESFYQPFIPDLVEELESKGLVKVEDGRKVVYVKGIKEPLTVVKSDGGYTYDTTDLAAIRYRLSEINADLIVYVVDKGQQNHFKQVFGVAKVAGWIKDHQHVTHVEFGLVKGEDGKKFRSRMGDTVKLADLLDEALVRAEESNTDDKIPDGYKDKVIKTIGIGAVKYADLSKTRTNDYIFSFDQMLALNGNTAPYLLYAYVRICSIGRKAGHYFEEALNMVDEFSITEQEEINLAIHLNRFPEILEKVQTTLMFHHISAYLYETSQLFSRFFKNCRCIFYDDDKKTVVRVEHSRLLLCKLTQMTMKLCFDILGMETIEYM